MYRSLQNNYKPKFSITIAKQIRTNTSVNKFGRGVTKLLHRYVVFIWNWNEEAYTSCRFYPLK